MERSLMPDVTTTAAVVPGVDQDVQRAAFERMRAKIEAIPREEAMRVNVDITYAAGLGAWVSGRLDPLRPQLEQLSTFIDLQAINELGDRAHALAYAHGDFLFATTPQEPMADLHKEGAKLIDLFLLSASALSAQGLLPNERVALVRTPTGYRNASEHLTALTKLFKDYWAEIGVKTGVTMQQIDRGAVLAVQLLEGSIDRMHAPLNPTEATLARERAYTLFYRAYDELRRAVTFLRWKEGDTERFVPTLFLRNPRRKGEAPSDAREGAASGGAEDAPPSPPDEGAPASSVPVGHRGGSPFGQA
jgi:hypothetical protein